MKRSAPMKRGKPMRRTAIKKPSAPPQFIGVPTGVARVVLRAGPEFRYGAPQVAALFRPMPKDNPLQHEGYMAAVRKLPCYGCGVRGLTQFCHADILGVGGKGERIKSDCRLGWPGCGPSFGMAELFSRGSWGEGGNGCHWYVGTSGQMPKLERHEFEAQAGRETRATIKRMGLWPADLPEWTE